MAIFLFFGSDIYSLREKLKFWQKEFERKYGGDINVSVLDGRDARAQEIFQTCAAIPFLAEKRFVIVKNFLTEGKDEEKSALAELLSKLPDSCVLIFSETEPIDRRIGLFKKIQKTGKTIEFNHLSGSKLLAWIENRVKKAGAEIERDAAISLAEIIPEDLHAMENEIAKLAAYCRGRTISRNDIELLTNSQLSVSIFKLTDFIGQKNKRGALKTLHQLIESGEDMHRILYMIMRQFRIITCVKDLASQGLGRDSISGKLREHPFVVSNTIPQTRNFSLAQLLRAYKLLINIDTKLKSGGIKILAGDNREFVLALDRLILNLCG